ncbi:hypothetical protein Q4610_13670 [Sphingobium sp. HBC34]|uniref:Uncharacterized protein n=1 Tax=Sphingobium cyanobacteriorum TaxID=3063954 RepID=A0ABT8ZQ62_9SPHN|nr:hypothetical protein [Sphingobium sp. HBC34]MDO7836094.1 hypothetical protein [Sphingobium sp. HBC34]
MLEAVRAIIEQHHPTVLILPNCKPKDAHRSPRVRALALALRHLGESNQMMVHQFDRAAIRQCFASVGARTKHEIALVIAEEIPAFRHRLPPIRKIWMNEDARQSLFDAAALGLAYFTSHTVRE